MILLEGLQLGVEPDGDAKLGGPVGEDALGPLLAHQAVALRREPREVGHRLGEAVPGLARHAFRDDDLHFVAPGRGGGREPAGEPGGGQGFHGRGHLPARLGLGGQARVAFHDERVDPVQSQEHGGGQSAQARSGDHNRRLWHGAPLYRRRRMFR